jgi:Acetyltransferase (GNAT) domain
VAARTHIALLGPADAEPYDRFIRAQPTSLFYHSWGYKEFLKALLGCREHYLVALEHGTIRGALPLMQADGPDGIYNSLPFFGTSAGIIAPDCGVYGELARAYNELARRPGTRSSTVVGSQFGPRRDRELLVYNFVDVRIAQLTPLPEHGDREAQLLAQFDPAARRNLRKAAAAGLTVDADPHEMRRLSAMHRAGMSAIGGTAKSDRFFDLVSASFKPGEDFDLYVARLDGATVAALLVFYHGQTVEYFVPAVDPSFRPLQPLPMIVATAMIDAARRGFRWWNWGGTWTTQTGVYRFKKKWGAIERPYAYYTQLNDEALRTWPRERLLNTWPHFFVLPFSALTASGIES